MVVERLSGTSNSYPKFHDTPGAPSNLLPAERNLSAKDSKL